MSRSYKIRPAFESVLLLREERFPPLAGVPRVFNILGSILLNFLLENWLLVMTALLSGVLLMLPSVKTGSRGAGISPAEAVRLINREKAVLIDVCDANEYAAGHASGARNVPLDTLESSKDLPSNKALPVVVMCASGARATRAADTLRKLGFENAKVLAGGLAAWREANLPIEKKAA